VTDDLSRYGLGALPDPPDERDYPISVLYASEGITASVVLPASYAAPGMPPLLDKYATPMCVAYSSFAAPGHAGAGKWRISGVWEDRPGAGAGRPHPPTDRGTRECPRARRRSAQHRDPRRAAAGTGTRANARC
jgi:hypothetical protein